MPQVTVERRGPVALVTIANPPDAHMDRETVPELDAATRELEADDSVRAVVLAGGVPGYFIRHYSVVELEGLSNTLRAQGVKVDRDHTIPPRDLDHVFRRIETMPKPVIAAVNGTAMGGGFELTLCCDIRIAEDGPYSLGLPEINVGILPGAGGTQKLARLVGTARALEMTLRGRTVTPAEALELGIVQELTPPGQSVDRALAVATEIAGKSPLAVAHIKRLVRMARETPLDDGLALERTLFLDLLVSDAALGLMHTMNTTTNDIRNVP
ncbi:MAG TPA: enoyl-CoA hydratase-related protein [Tepidiformaceae bacterium]|nr:enoyl-CoA hydratase-related protein [Tepidiformaceae bacterium]